MKKCIFASLILMVFTTANGQTNHINFTPDEIHGTCGITHITADNYEGAGITVDCKRNTVYISLKKIDMVGPLYIIDHNGIQRPNPDAFKTRRITSNIYSYVFPEAPQTSNGTGKGHLVVPPRKFAEGELTNVNWAGDPKVYSGIFIDKQWSSAWYLLVRYSGKFVIEVDIDNVTTQIVFRSSR